MPNSKATRSAISAAATKSAALVLAWTCHRLVVQAELFGPPAAAPKRRVASSSAASRSRRLDGPRAPAEGAKKEMREVEEEGAVDEEED